MKIPKIAEPNCPYCGETMVHGQVTVHSTPLGNLLNFLNMRWYSQQHLWFKRSDTSKDEIVLESGDARLGHRCPRCGAVSLL